MTSNKSADASNAVISQPGSGTGNAGKDGDGVTKPLVAGFKAKMDKVLGNGRLYGHSEKQQRAMSQWEEANPGGAKLGDGYSRAVGRGEAIGYTSGGMS